MASPDDLDELHREIIRELREGRCTPRYLSRSTGESRQLISQRLRDLVMAGWVEKIDKGLYQLNSNPFKQWHEVAHPAIQWAYVKQDISSSDAENLEAGVRLIQETAEGATVGYLTFELSQWFVEYLDKNEKSPSMEKIEEYLHDTV